MGGSAWEACMYDLLGSVDEDLSGDFESEHVSNEYGSEWSDTSGSGSDAGSASGSGSDAGSASGSGSDAGSDAEGSDAEGSEWSDASGAGSEGTFDSDSDLELAQYWDISADEPYVSYTDVESAIDDACGEIEDEEELMACVCSFGICH